MNRKPLPELGEFSTAARAGNGLYSVAGAIYWALLRSPCWELKLRANFEGPAMADRRFRVLRLPATRSSTCLRSFAGWLAHPALDLHVVYCQYARGGGRADPEFGKTIQWDVPLLEGYRWTHGLSNRGNGERNRFSDCAIPNCGADSFGRL